MTATRSLKCDECPKLFSIVELDAEDPQAWGHPCDASSGGCESHRSPQFDYLPTALCPHCSKDVCMRPDGTFVPHLRTGRAAPCEGSNQPAPLLVEDEPKPVDKNENQGSLF